MIMKPIKYTTVKEFIETPLSEIFNAAIIEFTASGEMDEIVREAVDEALKEIGEEMAQ